MPGASLGSTEYGIYVGAVALVALLAQYSALGSHSVFLRYVSPDPGKFPRYWANVVVTTAAMGSLFAAVLTWAGPHVSHSCSHGMLACVAVGDCVCAQFTLGGRRVFQAFERMRVTALLESLDEHCCGRCWRGRCCGRCIVPRRVNGYWRS